MYAERGDAVGRSEQMAFEEVKNTSKDEALRTSEAVFQRVKFATLKALFLKGQHSSERGGEQARVWIFYRNTEREDERTYV